MFASLDRAELPWVRRAVALAGRPALRTAFIAATRFGDGWGLAIVIPGAPAILGNRGLAAVAAGLASGLILAILVHALKLSLGRRRPDVEVRNPIAAPDVHAFPSGHAAQSFSVMVVSAWGHPALALALAPVAVAVGLSRVALGLHHPTDVVAGAVLGCGVAALTLWSLQASGVLGFLMWLGPLA